MPKVGSMGRHLTSTADMHYTLPYLSCKQGKDVPPPYSWLVLCHISMVQYQVWPEKFRMTNTLCLYHISMIQYQVLQVTKTSYICFIIRTSYQGRHVRKQNRYFQQLSLGWSLSTGKRPSRLDWHLICVLSWGCKTPLNQLSQGDFYPESWCKKPFQISMPTIQRKVKVRL